MICSSVERKITERDQISHESVMRLSPVIGKMQQTRSRSHRTGGPALLHGDMHRALQEALTFLKS